MAEILNKVLSDLHPTHLRYLFYMVTPNETTYGHIDEVPRLIDVAALWMFVLTIIEFFFLDERKYAFNDTITSVNAGVLNLMTKFGGRYISAVLYPWFYSHFCLIELDPTAASTWILCFFTQDLAYYTLHRAVHEFGVFWSFHQMHHSSEYYNLSSALRQGMWQDFGTAGIDLLQCVVIPPNMFLVHRYLNILYQFWLHTELVPHLGPLEYVFNTPSSHRVHHGRNPYCIDRNYAGTLIIWDRLFGTYAPEDENEKIAYGLVTNVNTFDQLYCQLFEFKALGYDKPNMKDEKGKEIFPGFWNKVKTVFMPPGYFPGVQTKWFFIWKCMVDSKEGIPEVNAAEVTPHDLPLSRALKYYLAIQFVHLMAVAMRFNDFRTEMDWSEFSCNVAFLLGSMQMFGYYFDHRQFCILFDCARLFGLAYYGFMCNSLSSILIAGLSTMAVIAISFAGQMPPIRTHKKID